LETNDFIKDSSIILVLLLAKMGQITKIRENRKEIVEEFQYFAYELNDGRENKEIFTKTKMEYIKVFEEE
jgi:hypothetical protein